MYLSSMVFLGRLIDRLSGPRWQFDMTEDEDNSTLSINRHPTLFCSYET